MGGGSNECATSIWTPTCAIQLHHKKGQAARASRTGGCQSESQEIDTLQGRMPLGVPLTTPRKVENIERTTKTFA